MLSQEQIATLLEGFIEKIREEEVIVSSFEVSLDPDSSSGDQYYSITFKGTDE